MYAYGKPLHITAPGLCQSMLYAVVNMAVWCGSVHLKLLAALLPFESVENV